MEPISDMKELQSKKKTIDKTLIKKFIWIALLIFDVTLSLVKIPLMSMFTLYKMMFSLKKDVHGQLVLVIFYY